jgi:5'-deoxynucleotidase YfbR-like HD superfamily hydrolase
MNGKKIKRTITLAHKAGALKQVLRTGWTLKGIKNVESVADHTWRMCFLCTILAPKSLSKERLLEMCIVHDLGEIGAGDIKWESGKIVIGSQKAKHKGEIASLNSLFRNIPNGRRFVKYVEDFNELRSPEARFLKLIDKLEMAIQALEYERMGHDPKNLQEFWDNVDKYLTGSELEPMFRELQKMRKK